MPKARPTNARAVLAPIDRARDSLYSRPFSILCTVSGAPVNQVIPANSHSAPQSTSGLLSELDLGPGQLARRPHKAPLEIEVIRQLGPADLAAIQNPPESAEGTPVVRQLRHSHHRIAELVAAGRPPAEISIVTGYAASYISSLRGDPAFNELVAYYEFQKREIFADSIERLKSLGLDAIERLHERLNDPEKVWSNKELMDLVEMSLVAPQQAKGTPGGTQAAANLNLEVRFVGAQAKDSPVLDATFTDITSK